MPVSQGWIVQNTQKACSYLEVVKLGIVFARGWLIGVAVVPMIKFSLRIRQMLMIPNSTLMSVVPM